MTSDATPAPSSAEGGRSYGELFNQSWDVDEPDSPDQPVPSSATAPQPPLRILEALLFVGGVPLTVERATAIIRGLTPEQFEHHLTTLNRVYRRQGRPYGIVRQGEGYVLALRPRFAEVSGKLYGGPREARLSTAALDVLALVAYRQPATKAEIDSLRGAESGSLLRQLIRRGLVTIVQRGEASQRDVAYGTTGRFLEFFGLASLDDLPHTQDLQQL